MAIIVFRGKHATDRLISEFNAEPLKEKLLYYPQTYHSPEFNSLIVPTMVWGGPITAILIEELYTLGVRTIIGFGAAGSINRIVEPGAIFVAEKALCTDGTCKEYSESLTAYPDPELLEYCRNHIHESELLYLTGLTIDSLYRETPRKIRNWRRLGADFINMEISPFYLVCNILGIKAIYTGLITDLVGEKWEGRYWGAKNEIDTKIIKHIKELCFWQRKK